MYCETEVAVVCYHCGMKTESIPLPTADDARAQLRAAMAQLEFARRYTLELLEATPEERWFEIPSGVPSCVAWQVGHLAVSQYGLLLFRIRGRRPEDLELIPGRFRKAYGRGSTPGRDSSGERSPAALLERLRQVDRQSRLELAEVDPAVLLEPVEMPYAGYPIKLGAILFCPLHEQIHAGQVGCLRRALGLSPIR